MNKCHGFVEEVCGIYKWRMRRNVYVTPKSYLSFVNLFIKIYQEKYSNLHSEEQKVTTGLTILMQTAEHIEALKIQLDKEGVKLAEQSKNVEELLKQLEIERKKTKEKADQVAIKK